MKPPRVSTPVLLLMAGDPRALRGGGAAAVCFPLFELPRVSADPAGVDLDLDQPPQLSERPYRFQLLDRVRRPTVLLLTLALNLEMLFGLGLRS